MDDSTSPLPPPSGPTRLAVARFVLPVVILIAAFLVHRLVAEDGERREGVQLDARAEGVAESLQRRVNAYGDVLYGVRGLFAASDRVTAAEFHASHLARDVERQYPGVQVVGFADLLRRDRVAARTAQIRREVRGSGLPYPSFQIRPAPHGPLVAPITYLEPQRGNEEAFGFDFLSEPHRRAALQRTLRSDRPEATAPVRLAQEPGDQSGFLVMLGVRDKLGNPAGVAYAGFRMGELVDRVVPRAHRGADIVIYDLGPVRGGPPRASEAQRTYGGDTDAEAEADRARRYGSRTIGFDVMGRRWMLRYVADQSLARDGQTLLNFVPLGLGLAVAALAAWLLGASLRTERRAVALAERMTETLRTSQTELARSNAELERFAYVASHDLREPLRTISSFLGLLSRRYDDRLDDDGREFIDLAVQGARRMDTLIAELLEYSR